jgi:hypothetical protein
VLLITGLPTSGTHTFGRHFLSFQKEGEPFQQIQFCLSFSNFGQKVVQGTQKKAR